MMFFASKQNKTREKVHLYKTGRTEVKNRKTVKRKKNSWIQLFFLRFAIKLFCFFYNYQLYIFGMVFAILYQ
jgi:hypothetical protein